MSTAQVNVETISFNADMIFITRLILQRHFEVDLKQFNQEELSYYDKPLEYTCPQKIIWAINDFLRNVKDDVIERIIKKTFNELELGKHLKDTQKLFRALLSSPEFKDTLRGKILTDSYVFDTTTQTEYQVFGMGNHTEKVYEIIALHPELNTIEKQDDFIMNKLKIKGFADDNAYYISLYQSHYSRKPQRKHLYQVNPYQTALDYLDLAEKQFEFARKIEKLEVKPTVCYEVAYGDYSDDIDQNDFKIKRYSDWTKMLGELAAYSPRMVMNYEPYQFADDINQIKPKLYTFQTSDYVKEILENLMNRRPYAEINYIKTVNDIDRHTEELISYT